MIFVIEELAVEIVVGVVFRAALGFVSGLLSDTERTPRPARKADRANEAKKHARPRQRHA